MQPSRRAPQLAVLAISCLTLVGSYALIKGEVSEKLALRHGAELGKRDIPTRRAGQWLPRGLDDKRWNFAPKEESDEPDAATLGTTSRRLVLQWAEALCGAFAFFAVWGVARGRFIRTLCAPARPDGSEPSPWGRRLVAIYLALFSLVLVRHALKLGYLSDRHTLTLVAATIPWAAAGTFVCARGVAVRLGWSARRSKLAAVASVVALIVAGIVLQSKSSHPSRWGHWAAGRWLQAHAASGDAILDTRGWAAFIAERPAYDYWHVRQAFTDSRLAYIVVGSGELKAPSRRAATLRAVLAYAATPVAEFPERLDRQGADVLIYRYRQPRSWEGLRP